MRRLPPLLSRPLKSHFYLLRGPRRDQNNSHRIWPALESGARRSNGRRGMIHSASQCRSSNVPAAFRPSTRLIDFNHPDIVVFLSQSLQCGRTGIDFPAGEQGVDNRIDGDLIWIMQCKRFDRTRLPNV